MAKRLSRDARVLGLWAAEDDMCASKGTVPVTYPSVPLEASAQQLSAYQQFLGQSRQEELGTGLIAMAFELVQQQENLYLQALGMGPGFGRTSPTSPLLSEVSAASAGQAPCAPPAVGTWPPTPDLIFDD